MPSNTPAQTHCIFCRIASGEAHAHTFWQSQTHMAFLSIFPNTPGTTVVIPKAHRDSYLFAPSNTDADLQALLAAARGVAAILDAKLDDVGRTGVVFEGLGVNHLHAKLYPMHGTKAQKEVWKPVESQLDSYFEQYPGYISSHDGPRASFEALAALCDKLRK